MQLAVIVNTQLRNETYNYRHPLSKKEHQESILDVARKVNAIAQTCEGHIDSGALLDEENDRIIMFSLWQNKESAFEASKILRPIIAEANFQDWERKPSDNMINMKRLV